MLRYVYLKIDIWWPGKSINLAFCMENSFVIAFTNLKSGWASQTIKSKLLTISSLPEGSASAYSMAWFRLAMQMSKMNSIVQIKMPWLSQMTWSNQNNLVTFCLAHLMDDWKQRSTLVYFVLYRNRRRTTRFQCTVCISGKTQKVRNISASGGQCSNIP